VHDYAGHPFQIQLSRELGRRGHTVDHQYCWSSVTGHGDMERRPSDPPGLTVTPIRLHRTFSRYRPAARVKQEVEYAAKAFRAITKGRPDVVVLCNVPLLANSLLSVLLAARRVRYVFWHQDVQCDAIRDVLRKRLPSPVARLVGHVAEVLERQIAVRARHVIGITDEFIAKYRAWRLPVDSYTIIPNWAEVARFSADASDRAWLGEHPARRHLVLYSGTLGLKHDPSVLLHLARAAELSDCTVAVVSEGRGRSWLADRRIPEPAERLVLRDFVPFSELPGLLASADVLISILEPAASRFSVPSKVLTYLCAGRPVVAVMDPRNAVARMITESSAGIVLSHADAARAPLVLRELLDDPDRRRRMGGAARAVAERQFDIGAIADRFEAVLRASSSTRPRRSRTTGDAATAHPATFLPSAAWHRPDGPVHLARSAGEGLSARRGRRATPDEPGAEDDPEQQSGALEQRPSEQDQQIEGQDAAQ